MAASVTLTAADLQHLRAADGYVDLGMHLEAEDELEKIDPYCRNLPQVLRVRLAVYHSLKRWDMMQMVARRLTRHDPSSVQWKTSLAYATRRADSVEAAKSILIEALKSHPEEAIVYYNLACYECQLSNLTDAKSYLMQATKRDSRFKLMALSDPDLELLWGWIAD